MSLIIDRRPCRGTMGQLTDVLGWVLDGLMGSGKSLIGPVSV